MVRFERRINMTLVLIYLNFAGKPFFYQAVHYFDIKLASEEVCFKII